MTDLDRLVENYQHWAARAALRELVEILRITSVEMFTRGAPGAEQALHATQLLRAFVVNAGTWTRRRRVGA